MAKTQEANIPALWAELQKYGQNQDWERSLKLSNKILQELPRDETAFHCRIVCMIQLGRFDGALKAMYKESKLSEGLLFERAYCQYRLNQSVEALKTIHSIQDPEPRTKELLAQVLYRLEKYDECFSVYKDVIKNSNDDYETERETNLSAVLAALQNWTGQDVDDPGLKEDTYELCYNNACLLLGKGKYKEAEEKLRQAEALCRESFEDDPDVTEDEIDEELGIVVVQRAYCLQMMGKEEEAMKMYNTVVKQRPSDMGLLAVASNNIVTIHKEQNVFDSKKKIKVATADGLHQKLTTEQRKLIAINQALLLMYTNQGDQCRKTVRSLQDKYPESDSPYLILASHYAKEKQINKALASLQECAEKYPDSSLNTKLILAQLNLSQGNIYQACDVLKSLGDDTYKPGVVSTLVALYSSEENHQSALEVLQKAVAWYGVNSPKSPEYIAIMRATANFEMRYGEPQSATKVLEELRKNDPKDLKTLAQLISAYSKFDQSKAQALSKHLPSPKAVASDVDVEALEASVSALGPRYMKKATMQTSPRPGSAGNDLVQKKKKKKKGKLPKNLDDPIDPERWLKRQERSYYRGRRKDKTKNIGKGPQGATTSAGDLDQSRTAQQTATEAGSPKPGSQPTPSPAAAPVGPRQQKPGGGGQKKKKKKGKGGW
ncbi:unnamed protein product [Owenia fusiformis]|uniref:Signal recognition particle subunit SRP72 n=1 Tax=Owenia fusiformis TaxID=6347 RepID=A0A8S4NMZ3_OWEFU|nr:unnamed protein product [Owenia fusiformis]